MRLATTDYIILFIVLFFIVLIYIRTIFNVDIVKKNIKKRYFGYKLFYADTKVNNTNVIQSKLLVSKKYDLKGKPDYIYKHIFLNKYLVVELKSKKIGNKNYPDDGHLNQVITYFLIVEDLYNKKPKYGYIVYADYMFKIKNTRKLRNHLLTIIYNMRDMLVTGESNEQINSNYMKCKNCICKDSVCKLC